MWWHFDVNKEFVRETHLKICTNANKGHFWQRKRGTIDLNVNINLVKKDQRGFTQNRLPSSNYVIFEMEKVKCVLMWLPAQNYENPNTVHFWVLSLSNFFNWHFKNLLISPVLARTQEVNIVFRNISKKFRKQDLKTEWCRYVNRFIQMNNKTSYIFWDKNHMI